MAGADGRGLAPAMGTGPSGAATCPGRVRRAEAAGAAGLSGLSGLLPVRAVPRVAAAAVVTFWRVLVCVVFTDIRTMYPVRGG